MAPSRPSLRLLVAVCVLLAAGAGGAGWAWSRARRPVRVLLVTPPPASGAGLSHYEARAIAALVQDQIEDLRFTAVTPTTRAPGNAGDLLRSEPWWHLSLEPYRKGNDLGFHGFVQRNDPHSPGPADPLDVPPCPPPEAMRRLQASLPKPLRDDAGAALIPRTESGYWALIRATALRLQNKNLQESTEWARSLSEREPGCATGWNTLANLLYRRLLNEPSAEGVRIREEAEACLRKAMALAPTHPRAALLWAQLKADGGAPREAFQTLFRCLDDHPFNPLLFTGVAYTARMVGRFDLAKKALDLRDRMAFTEHQPLIVDTLLIYLGDLSRFERSLQEQPGHLRVSIQRFYRGYVHLLKGERALALEAFRRSREVPDAFPHYLRLSEVYCLALEGRRDEALAALQALDRDRSGLQVPDGEFTIRQAEAHAVLQDPEGAIDLASRAFAQGFCAAAWFEKSPLLQPVQGLPRWQALLRHVKERQTLMEALEVPRRFR